MPDRDIEPYLRRLELALESGHYDRAHRVVDDFERTLQGDAITLDTPLASLDGLPVRIANTLAAVGVHCVGDAVARRPDELMALRGIGLSAVEQLVAAIVQGLEVGDDA